MRTYFHRNLTGLCEKRGLTISTLAKMSGTQPSTLLRYVKRGEDAVLKASVATAVATALGYTAEEMSTKDLLSEPENPEKRPAAKWLPKGCVPVYADFELINAINKEMQAANDETEAFTMQRLSYAVGYASDYTQPPPQQMASPEDKYDVENASELIAYVMPTAAMAPTILPGDLLYFRLFEYATDAFARTNREIIGLCANLKEEIVFVRRVIRGENDAVWYRADNENWVDKRTFQDPDAVLVGELHGLYRYARAPVIR